MVWWDMLQTHLVYDIEVVFERLRGYLPEILVENVDERSHKSEDV